MRTYRILIDGMGCQHCVDNVSRALTEAGFSVLSCGIGEARVTSELDAEGAEKAVRAALDDAGYPLLGVQADA